MTPVLAAVLVALAATSTLSQATSAQPLWMDPQESVSARLNSFLPELSVAQLAAQTQHLWTTVSMPEILATYNRTGVGASYIAHPTGNTSCDTDPQCNLAARLATNRALMASCGIPITFVSETLHSPWISQGVVMPMPVTMGASWNTTLLTEVGRVIAAEASVCGVTRGFSPEINVCTDPRFGRTEENFGSDAQHVAACGVAIATGLGGAGNMTSPDQYIASGRLSCEAKHLAAYGSGEMDGAPADLSPMTLHDIYLKPWRKFFAAGGRGAMLSHNSINGIPAHMHKQIMSDTIRGKWNHSHVFFASDYHDIDAIMGFKMAASLQDAAILAANAGMDQALGGNAFDSLADAVASGKLRTAILQRAASAMLREKFAGGLFDKKYDGHSDGDWGNLAKCRAYSDGGVLDNPDHRALAKRVAQEGTVLLKNGHTTRMADVGDAPAKAGPSCQFVNNSDCYGDGLGPGVPVTDAAGCCSLCERTPRCKTAVYIPANDEKKANTSDAHRCLLKAACSDPRDTSNRVRCNLPGVSPGSLEVGSLPLTASKWAAIKQLAIVGPNADNDAMIAGSYVKQGTQMATFLKAAPQYVPHSTKIVSAALNYTELIDGGHSEANSGGDPAANNHNPKIPGGINMNVLNKAQRQMIDDAVHAANGSDVTIAVLGDSRSTCGEGTDRVSLDLPGVQMQLLGALVALGKPLYVILVHGRPVTFGPENKALDGIDVLLASWIGGEEHGPALWEIINGEYNPSGRLAQVWPRSVGYVGTHVDSKFGPSGLWQGDYLGMGWRDGERNGPLFAFGFGLSYGQDTFSFIGGNYTASTSSESFSIGVKIESSSNSAPGDTVVQIYYSQLVAQAVRPKMMLLAFTKVNRPLSSAAQVTITIPTTDLGYYHPLTGTVSVDNGTYPLSLGTSSQHLTAHSSLTLR